MPEEPYRHGSADKSCTNVRFSQPIQSLHQASPPKTQFLQKITFNQSFLNISSLHIPRIAHSLKNLYLYSMQLWLCKFITLSIALQRKMLNVISCLLLPINIVGLSWVNLVIFIALSNWIETWFVVVDMKLLKNVHAVNFLFKFPVQNHYQQSKC